jgi:hypothetical protein
MIVLPDGGRRTDPRQPGRTGAQPFPAAGYGNRRLLSMTAAHDYDDLHHLVDRLSPHQAERLRVLVASDPELAPAAQAETEGKRTGQRRLSVIGIWESGCGDLSERHDEVIRGRLKHSA